MIINTKRRQIVGPFLKLFAKISHVLQNAMYIFLQIRLMSSFKSLFIITKKRCEGFLMKRNQIFNQIM